MTNHPEYVWYHGEESGVVLARIISRGAHASMIAYHFGGFNLEVMVDNDDLEFIGDDAIDDDD